jgi:hypothetical protein
MSYALLVLRPHVTLDSTVHRLIAPGTCWHFDAWLYQHGAELYLLVETRAGGRRELASHAYMIDGDRIRYVPAIPEGAVAVTMNDKALWPEFDRLNTIHWRYVLPMTNRIPAGFRGRSVALHYVRAPALEPFDGTEVNLHQYGKKDSVPDMYATVPLDGSVT